MKILVVGCSAIACAVLMALASCTSVEVVTVEKEVPVLPPIDLIKPCVIEAPPDELHYINSPWKVQEDLLMSNIALHLVNLQTCNVGINAYLNWRRKQELLFKDKGG